MRLLLRVIMLGVAVLASAGSAFASSHGAMPQDLTFFGMVLWEIEHFEIHMGLTSDALQMMLVSPELGLTLLSDQALCAPVTPVTAVLFGNAPTAITTCVITYGAGVGIVMWAAHRLYAAASIALRVPIAVRG